jgi:uncharacterized repeat protein (TIGR03803 family)
MKRHALTLILLSALLLIVGRPTWARTETVLYTFTGPYDRDGSGPQCRLTPDGAGNFYGTTVGGGLWGYGTVFEVSPNAAGGWNETVLYSFTGGTDGAYPLFSDLIFDNAGNLYGTTFYGGAFGYGQSGYGVVFQLKRVGTSWIESVVHNFAGGDGGAYPVNGVVMGPTGNLYGTTLNSPVDDGTDGTVYELKPVGVGWTEKVIYQGTRFGFAGLTIGATGDIFGVEPASVFELSPTGDGGWTATVIHLFSGAPNDGGEAEGSLVLDKAGNLYGTTAFGGANDSGTVYKLSPDKKGKWTETILYSFKDIYKSGRKDGFKPITGIVFDAARNIYGTTVFGGQYNNGTVFKLMAPVDSGRYKEKILHSFNTLDGQLPSGSLILDSAGSLYGTTFEGGSSDAGVVFEVGKKLVSSQTSTSQRARH